MPCNGCHGMDRREFLERTLMGMGVVALAACGVSTPAGPNISAFSINLADYPALNSVGGTAIVNHGSSPIAVVRTAETSYLALSLVCPHRGVTVSLTGSGFFCSGHGAAFSSNGSWVSGQHTSSLGHYATTFDSTAGTLAIG